MESKQELWGTEMSAAEKVKIFLLILIVISIWFTDFLLLDPTIH